MCTQFCNFTKISSFFKLFGNSWGNSYIQFVVIMIWFCLKKFQSTLWGVLVLLKLVVVDFYPNQFWGLPKLPSFHKTLKSISVCKPWKYCTNASSNHGLPLNYQLKKCYSILNHCEWYFIELSKRSGVL